MEERGEPSREVRVWYQSFVDPDEQRPYFQRLESIWIR